MLDPAIQKLLRSPLDTFEALEVAVALVRAPGQALSLAELVRTTALTRDQVALGIEELQEAELAHAAGGLVRLAVDARDVAAYHALADLHAKDPSAIAMVLSELALEKIRKMTMAYANRKKDGA